MKNEINKLIRIDWVDSQIVSLTWQYIADLKPEISKVSTVGFLISEDKEIVTIASSISYKDDSETQIGQIINIPKCCIVKRKIISF